MRNVLLGHNNSLKRRRSSLLPHCFLPGGELLCVRNSVYQISPRWKIKTAYCVLENSIIIACGPCFILPAASSGNGPSSFSCLLALCFFQWVQAESIESYNNLRIWMLDYRLETAFEQVISVPWFVNSFFLLLYLYFVIWILRLSSLQILIETRFMRFT